MKASMHLAGILLLIAALLGAAACSGDSPTNPGTAPTISQLQVQGAQRAAGGVGVLNLSFSFSDPEADIDRFVFDLDGDGRATNPLSNAQASGMISVVQTVALPAAGTQVSFSIFVLDRRDNRSNTLSGTFVAP